MQVMLYSRLYNCLFKAGCMLLLFFLFAHVALANNPALVPAPDRQALSTVADNIDISVVGSLDLNLKLQWLDEPGVFSVDQAVDAHQWQQGLSFTDRMKHKNELLWLRLKLLNLSDHTVERFLVFENSGVGQVHLFISQAESDQWLSYVSGEAQPFSLRDIQHRHVTFKLSVPARTQYDTYISLKGAGIEPLRLRIMDEASFESFREKTGLWISLILGSVAALSIVFFIVSALSKTARLILYGGYGICVFLFLLSQTGIGFQILWPEALFFQGVSDSIAFFGIMLFGILMIFQYQSQWSASSSRAMISISLVTFLVLIVGSFLSAPVYQVIQVAALLVLAFMGSSCVLLLRNKPDDDKHSKDVMSCSLMSTGFILMAVACVLEKTISELNAESVGCISMISLHYLLVTLGACYLLSDILNQRSRSKYKAMEAALQHQQKQWKSHVQMYYDPVTGLPNRLALQEMLSKLLEEQFDRQLCLFLVRVDGVADIVNTLGYYDGDELFRRIGRRLDRMAQQYPQAVEMDQSDFMSSGRSHPHVICVIDTKHFGILYQVDDEGEAGVERFGKRIVSGLSYPFEFKHLTLDAAAYVGESRYPDHGQTVDEVIQYAFVAVELAKQREEPIVHYDAQFNPYTARRLTLVSELKNALRLNLLELSFLPQVNLKDNKVVAVEALLRWDHPEYGVVSPHELVPLSEQTGVINPLTEWVLDKALAQASIWYHRGIRMRVCVNLSAKNLNKDDLPGLVSALLDKYDFPAEFLSLEITGEAMMHDSVKSIQVVSQLHELGVRLSLDDFGIGFSSLSYLKRLPVSEIKIDRLFVRDMCENISDLCDEFDDQIIVNMTLNMCHNLGLEVVAEGVEDERTLVALKRLGCDHVQGYYIAKPMSAEKLEQWFKSSPYYIVDLNSGDADDTTVRSSSQG